jgi:hypothetical protein
MGFWSLKGFYGDERTLSDTKQELAEVKGIINKYGNDKKFDKDYYREKSELEARIADLSRKVNKK